MLQGFNVSNMLSFSDNTTVSISLSHNFAEKSQNIWNAQINLVHSNIHVQKRSNLEDKSPYLFIF